MSAATAHPPVIPPRPSRSQDKDQMPKVPPRPSRRLDRSSSPNRDRFAQSPLNNPVFAASKSPKSPRFGIHNGAGLGLSADGAVADPVDRSASVEMPSVGEEGKEYDKVAEELGASRSASTSPEQTRSVGEDIKLHAPKPSLPAMSAKQRVAAVTRTDSDRAASFGIGRPSSDDVAPSNRSLKKKASTISQMSTDRDSHIDDEHGIPEIGKQVPMYPNAGDVQAPSPAPAAIDGAKPGRHHARKGSARGFADLPPGSYGLHGHGVKSQDKLERAYFEKHPDLLHKEHTPHHHDRAHDFSMSREELNKIVRDTASRGSGKDVGTPSEQVGWQAIEESASRITSPRPPSVAGPTSPSKRNSYNPEIAVSHAESSDDSGVIHVDDPSRRKSVMFTEDEASASERGEERNYNAPILADDEVAKDPRVYDMQPAVSPPPERSGSAFEMDPSSRPTSRPTSIYRDSSLDIRSTPLEDVEEYEPLFPEDEKAAKEAAPASENKESKKHRFPGRDIWEDAPDSAHYTAEVSTPDVPQAKDDNEEDEKPALPATPASPPRNVETPAHIFARRQEQLAEDEAKESPDAFLYRTQKSQKPTWIQSQPHLAKEKAKDSERPPPQRFPSRDVWEDTPDSHMLQTTVSHEQDEDSVDSPIEPSQKPEIPQRPTRTNAEQSSSTSGDKPVVPGRPKPKQAGPSDDGTTAATRPVVPDRPKPQVPARPLKHSPAREPETSSAAAAAAPKAKPAVPARPVGGKIAALQAGFMSDLNKRLQLGPQAPKKEDAPAATQDSAEEKEEKAPLVDARKGRARGPQRRAPAKSPAPAAALAAAPAKEAPVFSFSMPLTVFSIDPEEDKVQTTDDAGEPTAKDVPQETETAAEVKIPASEPEAEPVATGEKKPEEPEEPVDGSEEMPTASTEPKKEDEAVKTETLATNMAGESVIQADVKESEKQTVEPVKVEDVAKE